MDPPEVAGNPSTADHSIGLVQAMGESVLSETPNQDGASGSNDQGPCLTIPEFAFCPEHTLWDPNPTCNDVIVLRMLLSKDRAAQLIGSRGSRIRNVCSAHQCKIVVTEAPEPHDRTVVISANRRPDLDVERDVQALLSVHEITYPPSEMYDYFSITCLVARKEHVSRIMQNSEAAIQHLMDNTGSVLTIRDDDRPYALPEDVIIELFGHSRNMPELVRFMARQLRIHKFDPCMVSLFYICPDQMLNDRWRRMFSMEPVSSLDVSPSGAVVCIRGLEPDLEYLGSLIQTKFPELNTNLSVDYVGIYLRIQGPKYKIEDFKRIMEETVHRTGGYLY